MALTLQPVPPRYCVDCAHFKLATSTTEPRYARCVAPKAPVVGVNNSGEQYISAEVATASRPYASSLRADVALCGPDAGWFEPKGQSGG